jgi:hypothetical protein
MLLKSKKSRDRGRNRQSRQTRRMLFEPLEDRRLMTADLGGNTLAAARNVGHDSYFFADPKALLRLSFGA